MRVAAIIRGIILLLQWSLVLAAYPGDLFSPLISQKVLRTFQSLPRPIQYPHVTDSVAGKWIYVAPDWWTSGFFPATAYQLNIRKTRCANANPTDSVDWVSWGRSTSAALLTVTDQSDVGHDVGFISFPFMHELDINSNNQTAIDSVNAYARMLAKRFSPTVGCTRSWNAKSSSEANRFEVIMDNMINLELLYRSADLTGDDHLREIAMSHADKTAQNHIRADGSSYHVVVYDATTGAVIRKRTAQGYADDSTWSRGQSWGIYGFANMYRLSKKQLYLDTARKMAEYFLGHLPSDGVVPWDFNAPTPTYADSSAAVVTVNGLLMLSEHETDDTRRKRWRDGAVSLLQKTTNFAFRPSWDSLLSNGTANVPMGSFNTGIVYGDYYYIRAVNEMIRLGLIDCPGATSAAAGSKAANSTSTQAKPKGESQPATSSGHRMRPFQFWIS